MINKLILLSRVYKQFILMLADSVLLIAVLLIAFSLRLGSIYWPEGNLFWVIFGSPLLAIPIFLKFRLYNTIIRYLGFKSMWMTLQAVSMYSLLWGIIAFMIASQGTGSIQDVPRSIVFINWIIDIVLIVFFIMNARLDSTRVSNNE